MDGAVEDGQGTSVPEGWSWNVNVVDSSRRADDTRIMNNEVRWYFYIE